MYAPPPVAERSPSRARRVGNIAFKVLVGLTAFGMLVHRGSAHHAAAAAHEAPTGDLAPSATASAPPPPIVLPKKLGQLDPRGLSTF